MTETNPGEWRFQPTLLRSLALVGLAVSSALASDEILGIGTYCGVENPCAEVASSEYGQIGGVPLSTVGVAAFAAFFFLSLVATRPARTVLRVLAVGAGLAGLVLVSIQVAVLHRICPPCVVIDSIAVGMAIVALVHKPATARPSWLWVRVFGWTWAGLIAGLGPLFWAAAHLPSAAPPEIRAYWVPGKINVVEVSDFDCPACQRADPTVRAWVHRHDVHFVRVPVPMPRHPNAKSAGLAYLAAVKQGKGEEVAEALYSAPVRDPEECRRIAARLGLDMARYDRDIADPGADAQLEETRKWVLATDLGVPVIWIQDEALVGIKSPEALDAAHARAKPAP
jgi:uncharacterized membrane protein